MFHEFRNNRLRNETLREVCEPSRWTDRDSKDGGSVLGKKTRQLPCIILDIFYSDCLLEHLHYNINTSSRGYI